MTPTKITDSIRRLIETETHARLLHSENCELFSQLSKIEDGPNGYFALKNKRNKQLELLNKLKSDFQQSKEKIEETKQQIEILRNLRKYDVQKKEECINKIIADKDLINKKVAEIEKLEKETKELEVNLNESRDTRKSMEFVFQKMNEIVTQYTDKEHQQKREIFEMKEEIERLHKLLEKKRAEKIAHESHPEIEKSMEQFMKRREEVTFNKKPMPKFKKMIDAHSDTINSIRMTNTGDLFATASSDKTVKIWRVADGQSTHTIPIFTSSPFSLAYSCDDSFLVVGEYSGALQLIVSSSLTHKTSLNSHSKPVTAVAFPNIRSYPTVVSGSTDKRIIIWDYNKAEPQVSFYGPSGCYALSATGHGTIYSGHTEGAIKIWDRGAPSSTGEIQNCHEHSTITGLTVSPDDRYLLSVARDGSLSVADFRMLTPMCKWKFGSFMPSTQNTTGCWSPTEGSVSPTPKFVCVGSKNGGMVIGDITDNQIMFFPTREHGMGRNILGTAWSNDGRTIVTADDKRFALWIRE
ncbi:Protein tipD [Monocercomonoides exilis]|uniref:Protein tipD n=1 Tax=Monocercomonoides exilis TaxID=2049356 RepID=UPI00355A5154|nr:Protein tipD [Monocercomonoides exilis]|eukprot:MONOS_1172.1-p1 / transcript=MONOS_1172.1 / gene=MONOS_1172 / organism=Monocercomonoides_exilis_PA203 / gene_product=Protein tipD, putative / transcript_product=Protein tipD, putative / location=Mono_scaffold00020:21173-24002(+) / protein_length=522 / sequence_SO=supercontig / SO=protein_coding / is_pseudo=false